jgi:hypothetical protein
VTDSGAASASSAADPGGLLSGRFEGRLAFQQAVRAVLAAAADQGVRRMVWVGPSLTDWPVDEPAVLDDLTRWARGGPVQLIWLLGDFESLRSRLPRLVRWRLVWSHVVQCLAPLEVPASDMACFLLADDRWLIRVFDVARWRGRLTEDAQDIAQARQWLDAVLQRSVETFPVTTLGV